jgi:4-aminobutyrate--pyruvate transaminase
MGELFQARLRSFADHPLVGEARGVGLLGAIELVADKSSRQAFDPKQAVGAYCMGRCEANGLLVRALGDSMAFCPPLIIDESQVDELFDKFATALNETETWLKA